MKRAIVFILVLMMGLSGLAAQNAPPSGKFYLTVWEAGGMDMLEFIKSMNEMAGESTGGDAEDLYIELLSGNRFVMASVDADDEPTTGVFTMNGKNIVLTADGEDLPGTSTATPSPLK